VSGSKPLQLRVDFDLNSAKAGELPSGKAVHAIESRQTADGAVRMAVTPEGSAIILGWLTGVTKDGKKQLHELGHPVLQVIAAKPLAARDAFDLTSGKAGELAVNAFVHAFEARATADGAWRIGYAPEGASTIKAWVTAVTKDGTENLALLVGRRAGSSNGAGASASARSGARSSRISARFLGAAATGRSNDLALGSCTSCFDLFLCGLLGRALVEARSSNQPSSSR
jgi:hypothetical protein